VRNQIEYILVSRNGRGRIKNSRAYPSADIGSDHQLLLANLKFKLRSNRGASKIRKIDTAELRNEIVKHAYANSVEEELRKNLGERVPVQDAKQEVDGRWFTVKRAFHKAAEECLGRIRSINWCGWLSMTTADLANERRIAKCKPISRKTSKHHKSAKEDKEAHIDQVCAGIEQSHRSGKTRAVYDGIRLLTGTLAPRSSVKKDVDGVVITKSKGVKERWKDYSEGLYNDPNSTQDVNLLSLPSKLNNEDVLGMSVREVERAIQGLRLKKAVGYDEISTEEIQSATSGVGLLVMHEMYQNIWELEEIPEDWKRL